MDETKWMQYNLDTAFGDNLIDLPYNSIPKYFANSKISINFIEDLSQEDLDQVYDALFKACNAMAHELSKSFGIVFPELLMTPRGSNPSDMAWSISARFFLVRKRND